VDTSKIEGIINELLDMWGCDCKEQATIVSLDSQAGKTTAEIIHEYLIGEVEQYVDFIFVGNSGVDFKDNGDYNLGSVASMVVRKCKVNCMFITKKRPAN